mmetsp:Transcript_107014/g.284749  ORF Transcript_107014/g.284749 Transcript_107014/m.284749 type:complete len:271 (-) Transcript_107014:50-862(-)
MAALLWSLVLLLTSLSSLGLLFLLRAMRRCSQGTSASSAAPRSTGAPAGGGLSPEQLARLLGNLPSSDEADDRPSSGADGTAASATAPAASPPAQEGPTGEELLKALEGQDHGAALLAVQAAGAQAVNYADDVERNALMVAAAEGHLEACRELLGREDFGAASARTNVGATALHLAAGNDHVELCRCLIASPRFTVGINTADDRGFTPLDYSLEFGEGDARRVLEAAGGRRGTSGSLRQRRRQRELPGWQEPPEEQEEEGEGDAEMSALD